MPFVPKTTIFGSGVGDDDGIQRQGSVIAGVGEPFSGASQPLDMVGALLLMPLTALNQVLGAVNEGGKTWGPRQFTSWGELVQTTPTSVLNSRNIFG